jgi:hypothetical protein
MLLTLSAQASYTKLSNDILYRICRLSKSSTKISEGCYVQLQLRCRNASTQAVTFDDRCWLRIPLEVAKNTLEAGLVMLSRGDSVEFVMPHKIFAESMINFPKIKGIQGKDKVTVEVGVLRVVEPDIILDDGYDAFCKEQQRYEQQRIKAYQKQYADYKQVGEIWKKQLQVGNGRKAEKSGETMMISYEGRFLNSVVFDDGATREKAFRYVRGQQWQVVKGLEKALAGMTEGEKAQLILPSELAFGAKGLADIVPPYTPVIYEVEVVKVIKK